MPISYLSRFMKIFPPPLAAGYVPHLQIPEGQGGSTSSSEKSQLESLGKVVEEKAPAKSLSEIIGRTFLYRSRMQTSEKDKTSMNEESMESHSNVDFNSLASLVDQASKNASGRPVFINIDKNESLLRAFEGWGERIFPHFKPGKAEEESEANTQVGFSWLLLDSMVEAKNLISFQERVGDSMRVANYSELKKQDKIISRNSLLQDLKQEGWFPTENLANKLDQVLYEQPLRAEILNYLQEGIFSAKGVHEKARLKEEQVSVLAEKYPLPKNEIKAIFSEVSNFHEEAKGSLGTFMDLVKRYDLVKDHKSELAIIGAFSVLVNSVIVAGPLLNNIAISHSQPLLGLISLFTVPVLARAGGIAQEVYFTHFLSRIGDKIAQKTTPNMVGDPVTSAAQSLQIMNEGKFATVETIKAVCGSIPQVGIQSFGAAAVLLSSSSFLGPVALLLALASIPLGPLMARGMEKCQSELVKKRDEFAERLADYDGMRALQTEPRVRDLVAEKMLCEMLNIVEATRKADKKAVIFNGAPELLSGSGQLAIAVLAAFASSQDPISLMATLYGIRESMCQVHGPVAGAYAAIRRQIDVFGPRLATFHDTVMGERAGSGSKNLKGASSVQGHQITIKGFKLRSGDTLDEIIPEGSFTVVTGPHDAGKSSLLLRLSGVGSLGQGNISVANTDLKDLDIRGSGDSYQSKLVSFCGTRPLVFENLSLAKNISLNLEAEENKDQLMSLLRLAGFFETSQWAEDSLDPLTKKPMNLSPEATFSLDLARALFKNPKILVLDEPTLRIEDPGKIRKIQDVLARVHDELPNLTMICATHNPSIIDGDFKKKQIIRLPEVLTSSGEE